MSDDTPQYPTDENPPSDDSNHDGDSGRPNPTPPNNSDASSNEWIGQNPQDNTAASAIFLQMMRDAADRKEPSEVDRVALPADNPFNPNPTPPPIPPVTHVAPDPTPIAPEAYQELPLVSPIKGVPVYEPPEPTPIDMDPALKAERDSKLEAQRIQRVKRRKERRRRRNVGIMGGFFRTVFITFVSAILAGTIFMWFTEPEFLDQDVRTGLVVAEATNVATRQPTALPTPNWLRRIGIVSGHRGPENDPGAVCPDGLTEAEINFEVSSIVVRELRAQGYSVDLLDEFDPRLDNYQAAALVSIHANTCQDFGEFVSGYLVAKADARPDGGPDTELAECVAQEYGDKAQIERRFTLTLDMTDYHNFREIHPLTPAAILELGFMKDDRELLTQQQPLLAQGIVEGILCFLNPVSTVPALSPTASPNPQ